MDEPPAIGRPRIWALLLPLAAGAAAVVFSWQRWILPLVDSGREMDIPARLAAGERLYRDVTFYYGPAGPWINSLAIRLGGRHWVVLELLCAVLTAAILVLLYRLTARAGSVFSATVATTLAAVFCVGAPNGGGFLFPYSSSSLYALAGGLGALVGSGARPTLRNRALAALGLALALTARVELGAVAALLLLIAAVRSRPAREAVRGAVTIVAAGSLLALAAYAVAFAGIPWRDLVSAGPLTHFFALPSAWSELYLRVSGLDAPAQSLRWLLLSLVLDAAIVSVAAYLAGPRFLFAALLAAALLYFHLDGPRLDLPPLLFPLPVVAGVAALAVLKSPLDERGRARFLLFGFSAVVASRVVLGLSPGAKMVAYCALPLPGLLATAAVLAFDVLAPRLPDPGAFRRRIAAVLLALGALFLYLLEGLDRNPHLVHLKTPAGSLRIPYSEAESILEALDYLHRHARGGDTLAAFPEGGFFNFVSGLRSPLREEQIFPGVLDRESEAAAVRRIDERRPRFVLLCNRSTREYGPRSFGQDYAVDLWNEIEKRYVLTASFGKAPPWAPVGVHRFFIRVYEPAPPPTGGSATGTVQ
ncbi:MAG TPA: hypothetical protein VOA87_19680 [Thermoanaerobaculia bacterium]|nr:hypothetical protein [Thermoanaerobaculia bacterium]